MEDVEEDPKKEKYQVVTEEKNTKGGVDLVDQHLSIYPLCGKLGNN